MYASLCFCILFCYVMMSSLQCTEMEILFVQLVHIPAFSPIDACLCDEEMRQIFSDEATMEHLPFFRHEWTLEEIIGRRMDQVKKHSLAQSMYMYIYLQDEDDDAVSTRSQLGSQVGVDASKFSEIGSIVPEVGSYSENGKAHARRILTAANTFHGSTESVLRHRLIGTTGYTKVNLEERTGEFGIALDKRFTGLGYCLESHLYGLAYGFEVLQLKIIIFSTDERNKQMRGFLESFLIPLAFIGTEWNPTSYNYQLTAEQWPQARDAMQQKLMKRFGVLPP